jgi:hypothetical protein
MVDRQGASDVGHNVSLASSTSLRLLRGHRHDMSNSKHDLLRRYQSLGSYRNSLAGNVKFNCQYESARIECLSDSVPT